MNFATTALVAFVVFGIVMAGMAIGVIFSNRCLRGTCGGVGVTDAEGNELLCDTCPKRKQQACPHEHESAAS